MRAIISVSDKAGVTDFAKGLSQLGYEVFSTGGTKKALADAGVPVKSVSCPARPAGSPGAACRE